MITCGSAAPDCPFVCCVRAESVAKADRVLFASQSRRGESAVARPTRVCFWSACCLLHATCLPLLSGPSPLHSRSRSHSQSQSPPKQPPSSTLPSTILTAVAISIYIAIAIACLCHLIGAAPSCPKEHVHEPERNIHPRFRIPSTPSFSSVQVAFACFHRRRQPRRLSLSSFFSIHLLPYVLHSPPATGVVDNRHNVSMALLLVVLVTRTRLLNL